MAGIDRLISINKESLESIISKVNDMDLTYPLSGMLEKSDFSSDDQELINLLVNINYNQREFEYHDVNLLSISLLRVHDIDEEDVDKESLKEKIELVLNSQALNILAKGEVLKEFGGNRFVSTKVMSSMVPVFNEFGENPPFGYSIVNNQLNIKFRDESGRPNSILFNLDIDDLKELESCISRAIKKNDLIHNTSISFNNII